MYKYKFLYAVILMAGLSFFGFQCSSTEMTSAKLYIQQKNYDKALESLNKEIAKNPKSDEGYYYLGVVCFEKGQYEKEIDAFDKSLAISKKFEPQIKEAKLKTYYTMYNRGVLSFQSATKNKNEDSIKVYYDKSAEAFNVAIMSEPDSIGPYKNLAFVYLNTGKYEEAEKPLRKLVNEKKNLDGYKYLGEILYEKGKNFRTAYQTSKNAEDSVRAFKSYDEAILVLEEGRKLYPADMDLLATLSNAYIDANKVDVAISAFEEGVKRDPNNKFYRYNYGVLLLGANKFEEATNQFNEALRVDPNYQNAIYNLGVTYVKWGTFLNKRAEETNQLNNVEYKQKYELSLPYLKKVVELDNKNAAIWELLGKVYSVLGQKDLASDAFNKADTLRK